MTAVAQDFRLPDWVILDVALERFIGSYGNHALAAGELYRVILDGRLMCGVVSNPWVGPPARYVAPPEFWRQFGGIYVDGKGKPRFLPVSQGVGGMVLIPAEHRIFYARVADLDKLCPLPGSVKQKVPQLAARRYRAIVWATRIARQMKADGAIPEGINQANFAEMIARQMQKEVDDNPSLGKPPTQAHIRRRLKEWALRPPRLS